jgi:hypothetical protein
LVFAALSPEGLDVEAAQIEAVLTDMLGADLARTISGAASQVTGGVRVAQAVTGSGGYGGSLGGDTLN